MVRFLNTYISLQTEDRILFKTNVKKEVEYYKKKNAGTKPSVIFDLQATLSLLIHNKHEVLCAGRHAECINRAKALFESFRKFDIDMVFFLDGPIKEEKYPEWMRRKNGSYESEKKIFQNLKANEPLLSVRVPKYLKSYYWNFVQVAKKYGRIFLSLENECDLDLAEYAARTKPMAILTSDTDFLIMPGDFPIWTVHTLNIQNMNVTCWNKGRLRKSLNLQQWQMPIFSALCGNDWIGVDLVDHIRKRLIGNDTGKESSIVFMKALSALIRHDFQTPKGADKKLADLIYNGEACIKSYSEVVKLVGINMNFYSYNSHKPTRLEPDWLRDHVAETGGYAVFNLYKQRTLAIPQPCVDASKDDVCSFSELVIPILRREIGVLYSNQREASANITHNICFKPNANEPFTLGKFTPIFPDFNVPQLDDMLATDEDFVTLEQKLEIYAWLTAPKRTKTKVENLRKLLETVFIVPAVIANYLLKERQITLDEADILLLSIYEAWRMDPQKLAQLKPPQQITERPFWISFVFTNMFRHFEEAMTFCGLYKFVPYSYFDGFVFHKMYARFLVMSYEEKKTIVESIKDYRLYTM